MSFSKFGFTPTEGRVYQALLRSGPSTGYAIARELRIARANAYHALEGLVRRGAARRASSVPMRYTAIAPPQLLGTLERSFRRDLQELEASLRRLPVSDHDGGDWHVFDSAASLLDAAAVACGSAASELLAVTGPWAAALQQQLVAAGGRGVATRAVSLGKPAPDGMTVRDVSESELRAYWGALPVAVVADRRFAVCGVIERDGGGSGVSTSLPGVVPFIRHLLRRELAAA